MIRFKIDKKSTELLDKITNIYKFKRDTITGRIALSISIEKGKIFNEDEEGLASNGREYTPTSNLFGRLLNDVDNFVVYKSVLDQHYNRILSENDFIKLYKLHLKDGLHLWNRKLNTVNLTKGEHINLLLEPIQKGLNLRSGMVRTGAIKTTAKPAAEYKLPLSFSLGELEDGSDVEIKINDLREFDNRNIAIAGMAGSGKTQLMKDILYQISNNTDHQLKFIFFDYKGEGNPEQLKPFLDATHCEFVDIVNDGGIKFNPFSSINFDERQRPFSIRAFVDTVATFVPTMGVSQKNILNNLVSELFDETEENVYPSIERLFEKLQEYYDEHKRKPDSLYEAIQQLTYNLFSEVNDNILEKSLYLNLPPALSDTLRQLVVFLLLRYFQSYFSSTNDCEPEDHIFPLRYAIVIDEAHIYLKNKNARKALEELLRLLRSKGVIIVMLSQGVEDYRTKDFDFASQVKLPICLNVQNKDYKAISSFVGTPSSKYKLETEIKKLESGKGLINLGEPKIIELKQFWKTIQPENTATNFRF